MTCNKILFAKINEEFLVMLSGINFKPSLRPRASLLLSEVFFTSLIQNYFLSRNTKVKNTFVSSKVIRCQ